MGPAGQPGSAKFGQANVCLLLSPRRGGACTERRRMPSLARRSNGPQSRLAEGSCVEYPHRKDVILSEVIDRNAVDNEVEGSRVRGTSNGVSGSSSCSGLSWGRPSTAVVAQTSKGSFDWKAIRKRMSFGAQDDSVGARAQAIGSHPSLKLWGGVGQLVWFYLGAQFQVRMHSGTSPGRLATGKSLSSSDMPQP